MIRRALLAFPLAVLGALWFEYASLPWPVLLRWQEPGRTAMMRQREREAKRQHQALELRFQWVPLERISRHLRRAVIVAEDGRFYKHNGIDWAALRDEVRYRGDADFSLTDAADWRALRGALSYYRAHRDRIRGRSTITQQLAKNLYFGSERSLLRKVQEYVVARRIERLLGKERILELYLNTAELGAGIFGAEAAARHYFGRAAADLTRDQAAALAATLPHPLSSNPALRPGRMAWRKQLILARMGVRGPVETVPLAPPSVELEEPELELMPVPVDTITLPAPVDTLPTDTTGT